MKAGKKEAIEKFLIKARMVDLKETSRSSKSDVYTFSNNIVQLPVYSKESYIED